MVIIEIHNICWIDLNLQNSVAETFFNLWNYRPQKLVGVSSPMALVLDGIINIWKYVHWGLINVMNNLDL